MHDIKFSKALQQMEKQTVLHSYVCNAKRKTDSGFTLLPKLYLIEFMESPLSLPTNVEAAESFS